MFKKILIANRGEIAVRIAKTARRIGVQTVAVYSDADAGAPHVRACDEAVAIGPAPAAQSYLKADKIIDAALAAGAQAVHPGYGFLSENADFAEALENAGIVFIGPTAKTIRAMGSKSAAKDLMEKAGVPTTPGYQGDDQSLKTFKREAKRIGYPVLLKATAGGGGKGMRMVAKEAELEDALKSARREARSAFGDDRFLIEKYIARARHVEVQIFGDGTGNAVHMFERDCSVQRRHQKIIEEAPAPNLPAHVREKLLQAGVDAGKAVDYRGAGTVEFLYDGRNGVFFMEMNTRLQVEHPVSELVTGLDFVEWQLRIAAGEGLPLAQQDIREQGHAVEARLYAENPAQNFAPSVGRLTTLRLPEAVARIDSGVEEGQEITPYYDPMIAKIIAGGPTRNEALGNLRAALKETRVAGLETNASFLHALAAEPDFIAGDVSTRFIEEHEASLFETPAPGPAVWAAAALWRRLDSKSAVHPEAPCSFVLSPGRSRGLAPAQPGRDGPSVLLRMKGRLGSHPQSTGVAKDEGRKDPWRSLTGFRLNRPHHEVMWIEHDGAPALLRLNRIGDVFHATLEADASAAARREGHDPKEPIRFSFSGAAQRDGAVSLVIEGKAVDAFAAPHGAGLRVWIGAAHCDVALPDPLAGVSAHHSSEGSLVAPMPGVVTMLSAKPGDAVAAGRPLLVMEAMKMEHAVKAPFDGIVKAYKFKPGDQVKDGDLLVEFEERA